MTTEEIETLWDTVSEELREIVSGEIAPTPDISPIDALILVDEDQQQ